MNSYLFTPFIKTEYGTSKTRMDRSHVGARHGSCRWPLRTHYRLLGIILGETRHGAAKCTQGNKTTRYIILLLINFLKSGCAPVITTEGHVAWQEPGALAFGCLWQPFLTQPGHTCLISRHVSISQVSSLHSHIPTIQTFCTLLSLSYLYVQCVI